MKKLIAAIIFSAPLLVFCQSSKSEIWLLNVKSDGTRISFLNPRKITSGSGYDFQPTYSPDGKQIYFTSLSDTSNQSHIYSYSLSTGRVKQTTFSNRSEYSPTVHPTGTGLAVLQVEEDERQRIWEYPFSGGAPRLLFPQTDSIGYFTWVNRSSALAFVLSDGKTNHERLCLLTASGTEKVIAENVGRGIEVVGKSALFIKKDRADTYVCVTDFQDVKKLVKVPSKNLDITTLGEYVLIPNQEIIYGSKMFVKDGRVTGLAGFVPEQNLSSFGLKKISRIAISPDGKTMALANMQ